jgi:hypothetical protein
MTQMLASPERAAFYEDSPILTQETALEKFARWEAGNLVTSEMVAIGDITPTPEEAVLLQSRRLLRDNYDLVAPESSLHPATLALGSALVALARRDMERGGLEGDLTWNIRAGNYRDRVHREVWHTDNFRHPSVRWTVALGVGSTRGASGLVSKSDILTVGDLRPGIPVESGSILQPVVHPEGTVMRFMNSADIHAGPQGDGGRIMAQATLKLHR